MNILLLSKSDESYLEKCAQEHKFTYGIIIGHQAEPNKRISVHLARNNEEDGDLEDLTDLVLTIEDINAQSVAQQWLWASKMCPGSFDVMGIFVSSVRPEVINEQSEEFKGAKKLFADLHDLLIKSERPFGISTTDITQTDYIFLSYSTSSKQLLCKSYTYSNGGTFSPMDCRIVEKPFEWISFESNYELDEVYPIFENAKRINIEKQFRKIIDMSLKILSVSEIFIQNEMITDDHQYLQSYIKEKKDTNQPNNMVYKASVMLPVKCQLNKNGEVKVREFSGTMHMTGVISSQIYCNPRNTLGDVKRFVRNDIIRSLLARVQVYCDGLTDPNVSKDALYISEPPRRVYFNLPKEDHSSTTMIQFSEYIFRGEAPTVAVAQAKQILDIDIDAATINLDIEGLPDDNNTPPSVAHSDEEMLKSIHSSMPKRELSRNMYMLGIAVALLILLTSIALHHALSN